MPKLRKVQKLLCVYTVNTMVPNHGMHVEYMRAMQTVEKKDFGLKNEHRIELITTHPV